MDIQCAKCDHIQEMRYRGSVEEAARLYRHCDTPMEVKWAMPPAYCHNGPWITSDRHLRPHASKRAMVEHIHRKGLTLNDCD